MLEGDGAFPRQPVHGGKDLGPGITGQKGGEFIKRAGAGPSELLVDRRFDQKFLREAAEEPAGELERFLAACHRNSQAFNNKRLSEIVS